MKFYFVIVNDHIMQATGCSIYNPTKNYAIKLYLLAE